MPPVRAVGRFIGRCRHAPLILRQAVGEDGERPAGVIGGGGDQDPVHAATASMLAANSTSSAVEATRLGLPIKNAEPTRHVRGGQCRLRIKHVFF